MKRSMLSWFGLSLLATQAEPVDIRKPKSTSGQILQSIRQGSQRFWHSATNHYIGQQLRRPYECGRNQPCLCGSGKKFKKCCKP